MATAAGGLLQEVLSACIHPVGLAIIISNDYESISTLETLRETETDGKAMTEALKCLGYATIHRHNVTLTFLLNLLRQATQINYPTCCKRLVFVFAGHGKEGDNLLTSDERPIQIQEIVVKLSEIDNNAKITKLFFIDACRGTLDDKGKVIVSRGGKSIDETRIPISTYNFLIAHSTISGYRSYEIKNKGGIWMQALSRKLKEADKDINVVLIEVSKELQEQFQDQVQYPYMMMPESINRLTTSINLLQESKYCKCYLYYVILTKIVL